MESKVNYTIVGLFVVILTAAIIFSIIWLSSGFNNKSYTIYKVYMAESVTGLTNDSSVKYNGVDVGTVKEIKLDPHNPKQVELLLNIEKGTPITNCTTAILTAQGITGLAYLDLQNKGNDYTPLKAAPGEKYPVIKSAPSLYFRLDQALTELSTNFNNLSASLRAVFDEENRQAIKKTLQNLTTITTTLAGDSKRIDTIIENTATASKKFPHLIDSGESTIQNFSTQTMPKVNDILENVDHLTKNLNSASQSVKQNPAVLLRGQTPPQPGPGE